MKTPRPRLVRDIMSRNIVVLHEEDNLAIADAGLARFAFRHLPVVEGTKLIGIVSEHDLLRASVSTLDENHALLDHNLKRYFFVREIMTTELITTGPDTLLVDAARLIKEKRIGCLPVVEGGDELLGIVTQSDFVALTAKLLGDVEFARIESENPRPPARVLRLSPQ